MCQMDGDQLHGPGEYLHIINRLFIVTCEEWNPKNRAWRFVGDLKKVLFFTIMEQVFGKYHDGEKMVSTSVPSRVLPVEAAGLYLFAPSR